MFFLFKPPAKRIRSFLAAQEHELFSYSDIGASRERAPSGYTVDHNRVELGRGAEVFGRAVREIQHWRMFDMPWLQLCWPQAPIRAGTTVGVLVSHAGFWSLNACRIVYVIDEQSPLARYGFAYGTLTEHSERGEERFTVEFHSDDQIVWYDLCAFSRPGAWALLAYPFSRALQRKFIRDSGNAMQKAVKRA